MAKVKLDMSEYNTLMENKKQLEVTLNREKELSTTIKELQEEKIKLLEDAKMKVVKTITTRTEEIVLINKITGRQVADILRLLGISDVDYFITLIGGNITRNNALHTAHSYYPNFSSPHGILEIMADHFSNSNPETIMKSFFNKARAVSDPVEHVTTHGLDEIKEELAIQLKNELDDSIKDKLEKAKKSQAAFKELTEINTELAEKNKSLLASNKDLESSYKKLEKLNKKLSDKLIKLNKFKEEIRKAGFFKRISLVKEVWKL